MSPAKNRFSERSSAEQWLTVVVIAVSLVAVASAERDLQRRPADQVRGSKLPWRLLSLNALGAATYLPWGHITRRA